MLSTKADYRSHKEKILGFILIQSEAKYSHFLLVFQETKCCDLFLLLAWQLLRPRHLIIMAFYHSDIVSTRQIYTTCFNMQQTINAFQLPTVSSTTVLYKGVKSVYHQRTWIVLECINLYTSYDSVYFKTTIPYPERKGPRALSSAGPYPSVPPLRPKSGRTPLHQDCPTLVRGGRPEAWGHLLKRKTENYFVLCVADEFTVCI